MLSASKVIYKDIEVEALTRENESLKRAVQALKKDQFRRLRGEVAHYARKTLLKKGMHKRSSSKYA